jgi:hypothetical protein
MSEEPNPPSETPPDTPLGRIHVKRDPLLHVKFQGTEEDERLFQAMKDRLISGTAFREIVTAGDSAKTGISQTEADPVNETGEE